MVSRIACAVVAAVLFGGCFVGAASKKPCNYYFASGRGSTTQGPIAWLSGVWKLEGVGKLGELVWMPLEDGTMVGMSRRREPAARVRFYSIRQDEHGITLIELTDSGASTAFQAVEQGDRFVVFENADHGRVSLRQTNSVELELIWQPVNGPVERETMRLEI